MFPQVRGLVSLRVITSSQRRRAFPVAASIVARAFTLMDPCRLVDQFYGAGRAGSHSLAHIVDELRRDRIEPSSRVSLVGHFEGFRCDGHALCDSHAFFGDSYTGGFAGACHSRVRDERTGSEIIPLWVVTVCH